LGALPLFDPLDHEDDPKVDVVARSAYRRSIHMYVPCRGAVTYGAVQQPPAFADMALLERRVCQPPEVSRA